MARYFTVQKGPLIKLRIDLSALGKNFPLNESMPGGFESYLSIDRLRFDEARALLEGYDINSMSVLHEFCFILRWLEEGLRTLDEHRRPTGKFLEMWTELDRLNEYLLRTRITSVRFEGEVERDIAADNFVLKEEINIDRLCDGIRSVFRDEFHHDTSRRTTRGRRNWQRRKFEKLRNNILNWMNAVPELETLDLEEQADLIKKMSLLAGLPE